MSISNLFRQFYYYFLNRTPKIQSLFYILYRIGINLHQLRNLKFRLGFCPIFAEPSIFLFEPMTLRNTGICIKCGGTSRNHLIGTVLKNLFFLFNDEQKINPKINQETILNHEFNKYSLKSALKFIKMKNFNIFEPDSRGSIHNQLFYYPKYLFSEYHPDQKFGDVINGIRNEDLQKLIFKDNLFNILITQDVFEHIKDPTQAFKEIHRVLKPNGVHIFTVPLDMNYHTIKRIDKDDSVIVEPVIYHSDHVDSGGVKVYTDWGFDIIDYLNEIGFESFIISKKDFDSGIFLTEHVIISIKK